MSEVSHALRRDRGRYSKGSGAELVSREAVAAKDVLPWHACRGPRRPRSSFALVIDHQGGNHDVMQHFQRQAEERSRAPAQEITVSTRSTSELIGSIYDCALDPSRWESTLAQIKEELAGESIILSLNDVRRHRLVIDKNIGWGEDGMAQRQEHLPEIHARLSEWFSRGPSLDEPFVASRRLTADYLERSPYVQRCLKPRGIVDIMHLFLVYTPSHFSELVLGRHLRDGPITDREIELGALLVPHLRRAVTISNALDARVIERARMAEALDALGCGVILTSGEAIILHANRAAERMLRDGAGIQNRGRTLSAKVPAAAHELREAIRRASRNEASLGKTGLAVRLTDPEEPPLFAHVLPMSGGEIRTRLQPEAVAAVFIGSTMATAFDASPAETKEYLRCRYGLTQAEVEVALEILKGDGRDAAAARLGIAPTTVRTHLSRIFEKTGVRRQAELVRLLLNCHATATDD
jgi:DNA-binding CsgD family transcriptional regulator/PAS domain-containing protein